ncbi:PREDICTED: uncharacterized protein LOC109182776 isoform X2 [Ipomoea nil]|nr:PREDICTED: uncharacterized protein LOC109182776 isoform X2 [Ipomoea nil]
MQDRLQLQEHIQKDISFVVLQLSFVIAFTCVSYDDSHSTAIYLLSLLSKYMWHAKGVMLLACFAIIRGKSKVVSQPCHRKGLSYNMATLRNSLNSMISSDNEIVLNDSIRSMFNLTELMVELRHSSSMFLTNYWIAKSVVACAHFLMLDLEPQNHIMMELSNVSTKIKEILASSLPLLEAKRAEENYHALLHAFDNSSNVLDVLKLIFNIKNNKEKPIWYHHLFNYFPGPRGLDEFEGEGVLLLISSHKHLPFYAYFAAPTTAKVIWVPIINDLDEHIQMPDEFSYRCYLVLDPQKWIAPAFLRFLKNKCFPTFQVGGDPIVISLDKHGRLVHSNALHMIFTWGNQLSEWTIMGSIGGIIPSLENELRERTLGADRVIDDIDKQIHNFAIEVRTKVHDWMNVIEKKIKSSFRSYNYTREREQELWLQESWNLKLVVGASKYLVYKNRLTEWIYDDEKYTLLCGGNKIKQVQKFVLKVQEIRSKFQMDIEVVYIGRRGKMIDEDGSSACDDVFDLDDFKIFWAQLYGMASSRIQYLNKVGLDERSDEILQGLRKLLSYEDECTTIGSWALLSKGKRIIGCDMGDKMLEVLNEYEKWKNNAHANDFEQAFKDYYEMLNTSSSSSSSNQHSYYCALNHPSNLDKISETVSCPQCNHNMHKFVTFSCCHDPPDYLYY